MMLQEFEKLTGFYPSAELYEAIEAAYTDFPGDKQAFCKAYKANKDALAETVQRAALRARCAAQDEASAKEKAHAERVAALEAEVARLKEKLEREEEWQPFEDEHNVSQADYEAIAGTPDVRELSDEEAADLIAKEFGFHRSKITIVHEVRKQEINRHRQLRSVGMIPRKALFDVWDWNYICFNVRGNATMGYEMHNGELQMYWG